jgi:hypothetical protein
MEEKKEKLETKNELYTNYSAFVNNKKKTF